MIKIFTLTRENLGSPFSTVEFDAWMGKHATATVIGTSNSDLAMTVTVKYDPPKKEAVAADAVLAGAVEVQDAGFDLRPGAINKVVM